MQGRPSSNLHRWLQEVVIIGSGAFACEAMEAAAKAGAAKILLVSRKRKRQAATMLWLKSCSPPTSWRSYGTNAEYLCRWILPFSRQFTVTALTYVPFVPWRWKMALVRLYLRRRYYSKAGIAHVAPSESTADMDYTGAPACVPVF